MFLARQFCSRKIIRYSFVRFLLTIAFFLSIFVLWMTQWNRKLSNVVGDVELVDVDLEKIIQGKMIDAVGRQNVVVDYFVDDKASTDEYELDYFSEPAMSVEINEGIKDRNFVDIKPNLIGLHRIPKPTLSPEILDIHRRLNWTNPGHLGEKVVIPANAPEDILQMSNKSWEIYKINEIGSNLIPLDRELPDMRTDYCRNKTYAANLPTASVITVFHNEALSMILRTVYSLLIKSPPHLLKEIILVDDCSTHGKKISSFCKGEVSTKI